MHVSWPLIVVYIQLTMRATELIKLSPIKQHTPLVKKKTGVKHSEIWSTSGPKRDPYSSTGPIINA